MDGFIPVAIAQPANEECNVVIDLLLSRPMHLTIRHIFPLSLKRLISYSDFVSDGTLVTHARLSMLLQPENIRLFFMK